MYRNLEAELILKGANKKSVAPALGIGYGTLLSKLKGDSAFTLDEAFKLRKLLSSEKSIEELFAKTPKSTYQN